MGTLPDRLQSGVLPVLDLRGKPREQGRGHGEAVRSLIREIDALWREDIAHDLDIDPEEYIFQLTRTTGFLKAAELHTPDLVEEVRGIAEGSGLEFYSVFARQLCDEDWWFRFEKRYGFEQGDHCSSLGYASDELVLIAQNMDTPAYWDGLQVLLHLINPDGYEAYVFTVAGSLALCGMSNSGNGVCCNTILQCNHSRDGLPEQFVVRSIMRARSRASAVEKILNIPHASPQNYLIGDHEGVTDLEVSANAIAEYRPHPAVVYHSNHPLANQDQSQFNHLLNKLPEDLRDGMVSGSTTLARFRLLEHEMAQLVTAPTHDFIKRVLRTSPVCVAKDEKRITLGSVIFEFRPELRMLVASGPPDQAEYKEYTCLSTDGPAKNGSTNPA